jgi:hypothetical protein
MAGQGLDGDGGAGGEGCEGSGYLDGLGR